MTGPLVYIFPGQGSQSLGMGRELSDNFPEARTIFETADRVLGWPLSKICFDGPEEELKRTSITQPAIFTVSCAAFEILNTRGLAAAAVAGHSLGEYSALYAARAAGFEELLKLVARRGQLMEESSPKDGAMAAIIGLTAEKVNQICQETGPGVVLANINTPEQLVISGLKTQVEAAAAAAKTAGAKKVIFLEVSGPFHSPFMKEVAGELKTTLEGFNFSSARVPVISNVTARPVTAAAEIKNLLIEQVYSPVRWVETVEYLVGQGFNNFVEVGPGKVLQGLLRRINPDVKLCGVSDKKSFEKTCQELNIACQI